jgi:hypothetical protein
MPRDQNAGQNHYIKIDNKSLERVDQFRYLEITLMNQKVHSGRNKGQTEVRKCFLSFGAESFVLQLAIQKYKVFLRYTEL